MLTEVVVELGNGVLAEVGVEDSSGALVETVGVGALVAVVVDTVTRALVEVVHVVGTGAFVVVDSENVLHVSLNLSGRLAQRPW